MDKVEYRELIRSIKTKYLQHDYEGVTGVAGQIDPEKIKENSILEMLAASYEHLGRYDLARDTLLIAYKRTPTGKRIAYNLALLSIKLDDLDGAVMFYEDFCKMAPKDNKRLLLKYEIGKAGGVPVKNLARVLENYNSHETDDRWLYELARLYHEMGDDEKCASTCDQIILWYANGEYEKKALELKNMHKALTNSQQARYEEIMSNVLPAAYTGASGKDVEEAEHAAAFQEAEQAAVAEEISEVTADAIQAEGTQEEPEQPKADMPEAVPEPAEEPSAAEQEEIPATAAEPETQAVSNRETVIHTTKEPAGIAEPAFIDTSWAFDESYTNMLDAIRGKKQQSLFEEEAPAQEAVPQDVSAQVQSPETGSTAYVQESAAVTDEPAQQTETVAQAAAKAAPMVKEETTATAGAVDAEDEPGNVEGQMSLFTMFEAFKNQTIEDREQMNKLGEERAAQILAAVNDAHDSSALELFEEEEDEGTIEEIIEPEVPLLNREDIIEPVDDGGVDLGERAAEFPFEKDEEPEEEIQHTRELSIDATQFIPVDQIASQLANEKYAQDDEAVAPSVVNETSFYSEIDPGSARGKVSVGSTAQEEAYLDELEPGRQITKAERAIIAYETTKMLQSEEEDVDPSDFNLNDLMGTMEDEVQEAAGKENEAAEAVGSHEVENKETADVADATDQTDDSDIADGAEISVEDETDADDAIAASAEPAAAENDTWVLVETQKEAAAAGMAEPADGMFAEEVEEPVAEVPYTNPAEKADEASVPEEPELEVIAVQQEEDRASSGNIALMFEEDSRDSDYDEEAYEDAAEDPEEYEEDIDPQRAREDAVLNMGSVFRTRKPSRTRAEKERVQRKHRAVRQERAVKPEPEEDFEREEEEEIVKAPARGNAKAKERPEKKREKRSFGGFFSNIHKKKAAEAIEEEELYDQPLQEWTEEEPLPASQELELQLREAVQELNLTMDAETETFSYTEEVLFEEELQPEAFRESVQTAQDAVEATYEPEQAVEPEAWEEPVLQAEVAQESEPVTIAVEQAEPATQESEPLAQAAATAASEISETVKEAEPVADAENAMEETAAELEQAAQDVQAIPEAVQGTVDSDGNLEQWFEEDDMLSDPERISRSAHGIKEIKSVRSFKDRFFTRKPKAPKEEEEFFEEEETREIPAEQEHTKGVVDSEKPAKAPKAAKAPKPAKAQKQDKEEKAAKSADTPKAVKGNKSQELIEAKQEAKRLRNEARIQAKIEREQEKAAKSQLKLQKINEARQQREQEAKELDFDELLASAIHESPEAKKPVITTENLDDILNETIKAQLSPAKESTGDSLDDFLASTINPNSVPSKKEEIMSGLDDILSVINPDSKKQAGPILETTKLNNILGTLKSSPNMTAAPSAVQASAPVVREEPQEIQEQHKISIDDLLSETIQNIAEESDVAAGSEPDIAEFVKSDEPAADWKEQETQGWTEAVAQELQEEVLQEAKSQQPTPLRYDPEAKGYQLTQQQRKDLGEFLLIDGMEEAICNTIDQLITRKESGDETGGHLIVTGDAKTGKTYLAIEILKAVNQEIGHGNPRVAKVQSEAINGKSITKVLSKVADSDLIIENLEKMEDETVANLIAAMEESSASTMVILEGNKMAADNIIHNFPEITRLFKTRIDIGELSLTQWADVAKDYAAEKGYSIDGVALLALHARIDEINTPDTRLGYSQVCVVVDDAIDEAKKRVTGMTGMLFSAFSKKNGEKALTALLEEDFM